MSAIASPYGLRPVQLLGGGPFAGAIRSYSLLSNSAAGFFFGDPVGISATGVLTAMAATPTTTVDVNSPIGIFMGCEYQDPVRGFVNSQFFPANGISGGATQVKFKILDHPLVVLRVQANGSVTADKVGKNVAIAGPFTGGSTATGDSIIAASATAAATATLALKIIGFPKDPGNAPGDAFTDLYVIWNAGVHRWMAAAGL